MVKKIQKSVVCVCMDGTKALPDVGIGEMALSFQDSEEWRRL